jgi:hypothetical protein
MADVVMNNLSGFSSKHPSLPGDSLVEMLIEEKDIEQLTNINVQLFEECKHFKAFPQCELYSTRKPKGTGICNNLEDRLADDIYELRNFLDTRVFTSAIKSMIKPDRISLIETSTDNSQSSLAPIGDDPGPFPVSISR